MDIVIVEDDKVLSLLLTKMVEKLDYNVLDVITKGQDAIGRIDELRPNLILMDIMLEDNIDGISAMVELRKKGINIPVVYITGNSDPLNRERAEATDYLDYLIKPVGFEELKSTMQSVNGSKKS